jgi:WD40 repeat protein
MDDHKDTIMSVAWSPDGIYLASAAYTGLDRYSLRIWDGSTYSLLHEYSAGAINSLAWHPSKYEIALANEGRAVYTVTVSSEGVEYIGLSYDNPYAMRSVAWNKDGTRLASGDAAGNINVFQATTFGNLETLTGHSDSVDALVWSPDDTHLASASEDGTVRTWDIATGENINVFPNPKITLTTSIDWDGNLLTFGQADAQIATIFFPTATAGPDQTITDTDNSGSESVTLDGSASTDSDGTITSYVWTDSGGTEIATGATPTVDLAVGTHTITLTVTDDDDATATDDVVITVEAGDFAPTPSKSR